MRLGDAGLEVAAPGDLGSSVIDGAISCTDDSCNGADGKEADVNAVISSWMFPGGEGVVGLPWCSRDADGGVAERGNSASAGSAADGIAAASPAACSCAIPAAGAAAEQQLALSSCVTAAAAPTAAATSGAAAAVLKASAGVVPAAAAGVVLGFAPAAVTTAGTV